MSACATWPQAPSRADAPFRSRLPVPAGTGPRALGGTGRTTALSPRAVARSDAARLAASTTSCIPSPIGLVVADGDIWTSLSGCSDVRNLPFCQHCLPRSCQSQNVARKPWLQPGAGSPSRVCPTCAGWPERHPSGRPATRNASLTRAACAGSRKGQSGMKASVVRRGWIRKVSRTATRASSTRPVSAAHTTRQCQHRP